MLLFTNEKVYIIIKLIELLIHMHFFFLTVCFQFYFVVVSGIQLSG